MFTLSGLRSSLLFKFLENQILRPIRHSFLRIRAIFAARAASLTRLCSQRARIESSSLTLHVIRNLKAQVYFTFRFLFRFLHSRVRTAFKAYSSTNEHGLPSSTHAQYNCLDSSLCCLFLAHALLYKKLPARGARLSASPPDDENYVMWMVHGHGWPKYTLAFTPATLCSDFAACTLCMERSRRFGVVQTMHWHKCDHVKFELTHNYRYRPISAWIIGYRIGREIQYLCIPNTHTYIYIHTHIYILVVGHYRR